MRYMLESDYSRDYVKWIQYLNVELIDPQYANRHKSDYSEQDLDKLQRLIIQDGNAAFAYFFCLSFQYKHYKMQEVIFKQKDAKYAVAFAQNIALCDVKALQKIVVQSGKIKYITKFACFVKGAERQLLEQLIIKSKDVKCAHMYLKHVKEAKVDKFKHIILQSGKPRYLFELAKHFTTRAEVEQIEDLIIASGSFTYMRIFADKIKLADVDKIEQAVFNSGNQGEMKKFAKYVRRSKMKPFLLVV